MLCCFLWCRGIAEILVSVNGVARDFRVSVVFGRLDREVQRRYCITFCYILLKIGIRTIFIPDIVNSSVPSQK